MRRATLCSWKRWSCGVASRGSRRSDARFRDGDHVRHTWGCELLYVTPEPGQLYRHNYLMDLLWNVLDLTPEGRCDFNAEVRYP